MSANYCLSNGASRLFPYLREKVESITLPRKDRTKRDDWFENRSQLVNLEQCLLELKAI